MKKRFMGTIAALMALMLVLAGCGSSESSGGSSGGNSAGSTLIYGKGGDAVSLDPAAVTDGESLLVTEQMFETLVNYDKQTTDIVPGLAKKWEISEDGLTYTFELEEGVKFHDGTDFNAEAVVKNFQRWAKSHDEGKFAYYASQFGGFEGDEGHVIKEVKADGEYKVVFTLNRPQAPFLKNLAMSPFVISSPAAFEKHGETPIGTGPYKFESWKRNDTITVVKNEDYWKEGLPKTDKVIFKVIEDNSARLNALTKGEVDLIDGVNPSDVEKIKADQGLQIFERPSLNVAYLGFNVEKEPFNNPKVRQALSHAVNKEAIIENFFGGTADPAKNPMPPTLAGYNDEIQGYEFDLEKAKKLLEEAGYKDGFNVDLWAMPVPRPYMPNGQKVAEAIQADFEKIGVKANIVTMEWATYLEKLQAGESPLFMMGWTGDNGDADNFLYTLLDQDNIGSNNYSRYANEEVHKLLIEAQSEVDEAKREELYKKAQELIHADAPWVPLAHSTPLLAGKSTIEGFFPHPTGSQPLAEVTIK
ncbi:MAG TPA: ABC transporter substrate-binding protein [Chondromyces sp.]|nr:ABC transporter substrate-binding protein [Chondromyces sp.]